jgi:membrane fusion protein (multidrug efflux system)
MLRRRWILLTLAAAIAAAGCSGGDAHVGPGSGGPGGGHRGRGGGDRGGSTAVPVEVASVERRSISSYIETNGALEAENEVDLVARVSAPIVELLAEEGMAVRKGQTLARLDDVEISAQLEIARVALNEATLGYDRAKRLYEGNLISEEEYEQAKSSWESATAQFEASKIQLGYTRVSAPFDGLIVTRYVDFAEQLSVNTPLFRISDFDPLLCPIQVPERELSKLHSNQSAHLLLEPWPGHEFQARVLRISPIVDAATGTIKVTLEVRSEGKLRPGMFASVFLETDTHDDALVVPKSALSLESIGDTVYVAADGVASRREVTLGYRDGDFVEVTQGVTDGEPVVVVGHDGLSDGTPVEILVADGAAPAAEAVASAGPLPGGPGRPGGGRPGMDFSSMSPEQQERVKQHMRARGMSEEQIKERLEGGGGPPAEQGGGPRGDRRGPAGRPDFSAMSPDQLERAKQFMRQRGMTEEQIEERIRAGGERSGPDGR